MMLSSRLAQRNEQSGFILGRYVAPGPGPASILDKANMQRALQRMLVGRIK